MGCDERGMIRYRKWGNEHLKLSLGSLPRTLARPVRVITCGCYYQAYTYLPSLHLQAYNASFSIISHTK
jgi:hypothetical protein